MAEKFEIIVEFLERVEKTSSRIEKTKILAELFNKVNDNRLPYIINGLIWPPWEGKELGVSRNILFNVLQKISKIDTEELFIHTGDVGAVAEEAARNMKQKPFFTQPITIDRLYDAFEKLASTSGENSQKRKENIIMSLFMDASPKEAKYIARLIVSEMRTGVADGIIRDAIAQATDNNPSDVEKAFMITSDWRRVVDLARKKELSTVTIEPLHPIAQMLAHVAESIESALNEHENNIVEWKYDGARIQVHKLGDKVKIYSRRLEDVTESLPEVVEGTKHLNADSIIYEGEALAIDKNGKVLPFQYVLKRFRRKKNIDEAMKNIKIEVRVFDVLYYNGEPLIEKPLHERRKILEKVFPSNVYRPVTTIFKPSHAIITDDPDEAETFYNKALENGHEGVMIKDLNSPYEAGKRGKKWLKYKPIMEPLDLVITGAEWGDGKRTGLLGAFEVSVLDEGTGEYVPVGKVGTGFTDDDLAEFTRMLKPLITHEEGKFVRVQPKIIITVAYQEIQKSPKYKSGYALRFPRFVALREDKDEPDTVGRVIRLYNIQKKK